MLGFLPPSRSASGREALLVSWIVSPRAWENQVEKAGKTPAAGAQQPPSERKEGRRGKEEGGWRQIPRDLSYDALETGVGLLCGEETPWALKQKKVMDKTYSH